MLSQDQVKELRRDFPSLRQRHPKNRRHPVYLDNSCVTLTPRPVAEAIWDYSVSHPGCGGHRSGHWFSSLTEEKVARARRALGEMLGVPLIRGADGVAVHPVLFTRNTTEGLNLVANCIGLLPGETVVLTDKEHNSNLCPWQEFERRGGRLRFVPVRDDNAFDLEGFAEALEHDQSVKLVALHHASNLDGVGVPLREAVDVVRRVEQAQRRNIFVCVDGAQAAPHRRLNLGHSDRPGYLDVDFYAGSLHKMLGPTGVGFLYGRPECLDGLRPFMVGGSTIFETSITERPVYADWPDRFEAGLQNYAGLIGAGRAAEYLEPLLDEIKPYEHHLNGVLTDIIEPLHRRERLRILGPLDPERRGSVVTAVVPGDRDDARVQRFENEAREWNIMYRSGHFCVDSWFASNAHRLPNRYAALRFSFYFYNTPREVELAAGLVARVFGED